MNINDGERIANVLESHGHSPIPKENEADLVVINVCSVRQSAVDRVSGKIKNLRKGNPKAKIILTGCVLKNDRKKFKEKVDEIWDIAGFDLKAKHCASLSAYVPIMTGCNNFCTYCVVPYTRGKEKSRPAEEIICEAKILVKKGCKEITLLGQNVNSYRSGNIDFSKLLKKINDLPGNFQIKFLTSHPKDMSDELINVIAGCQKIAKEIHLPIQSGDNIVLKKMNRNYTVSHYKKLVKKIRGIVPEIKISTDVIVAFPGETKKQFENTVKLFKEIRFDMAYIAKYSPRSGTTAFYLKDNVLIREKKRRYNILNEVFKKYKPAERYAKK